MTWQYVTCSSVCAAVVPQSCIDGKPKMVRFLLDHGADVNIADYEGWVPLHAACYCAAEDIVE